MSAWRCMDTVGVCPLNFCRCPRCLLASVVAACLVLESVSVQSVHHPFGYLTSGIHGPLGAASDSKSPDLIARRPGSDLAAPRILSSFTSRFFRAFQPSRCRKKTKGTRTDCSATPGMAPGRSGSCNSSGTSKLACLPSSIQRMTILCGRLAWTLTAEGQKQNAFRRSWPQLRRFVYGMLVLASAMAFYINLRRSCGSVRRLLVKRHSCA